MRLEPGRKVDSFYLLTALTCLRTRHPTATLSWWNLKTPFSEQSPTCAGAGESSPSPPGWDLSLDGVNKSGNLCFYVCFFPGIQVSKKDKSEPKILSITPTEKTHFRVIISTDALEEQCGKIDPACSIIKPEPRTIRLEPHNLKLQPLEASPCDTNFTNNEPELSDLTNNGFPCPANTEVGTKCAQKTRWTSSPPSRRDSGSAASGGSAKADSRAADSPSTKRGNTY